MADNKNKTPDQLKTIEESLTKAEKDFLFDASKNI